MTRRTFCPARTCTLYPWQQQQHPAVCCVQRVISAFQPELTLLLDFLVRVAFCCPFPTQPGCCCMSAHT